MLSESKLADAFKNVYGIDPRQHDGTFSMEQLRSFAAELGLQYAEDISKENPGKMPTREERERNKKFLESWLPGAIKIMTREVKGVTIFGAGGGGGSGWEDKNATFAVASGGRGGGMIGSTPPVGTSSYHTSLTEAEAKAYFGPDVVALKNEEYAKKLARDEYMRFKSSLTTFFIAETEQICKGYNSTRYNKDEPELDGAKIGKAMAEAALTFLGPNTRIIDEVSTVVDYMQTAANQHTGKGYQYVQNWQGTRDLARRVYLAFYKHWRNQNAVSGR